MAHPKVVGEQLDLPDEVYGFGSWLLWLLATHATDVVDQAFAAGPARPSRHYGMVDGHPVPTPSLVAWLLTAAEAGISIDQLPRRDRRLDERQKVLRTIVSRAIGGEPRLFKDGWLRELAAVCRLGDQELDLLARCRDEEGYPVEPEALRKAISQTLRSRPGAGDRTEAVIRPGQAVPAQPRPRYEFDIDQRGLGQANAEKLVEGAKHVLRPAPETRQRRRRMAQSSSGIAAPVAEETPWRDHPGFIRSLSRLKLVLAGLGLAAIVLATLAGLHFSGSGSARGLTPPTPSARGLTPPTPSAPGLTPPTPSAPGLPSPPPGVRVTDDTKTISVIVPESWNNIWYGWAPQEHIPRIIYGTVIGQGLNASPNVQRWFSDLTTPGIFVGASKLLVADHYTPATALMAFGTQCDFFSQQPVTTDGLTGYLDMWTCPQSTTRFETVALWPGNHSFIAFIELKIVTPADEASGNRALASLSIRY